MSPRDPGRAAAARRRGRRPGSPGTRDAILAAARDLFAERGYGGASVRAIAAGAGVDAALVHHYFGTKDQLFVAAVGLPADPQAILSAAAAHGPDRVGEGLVRAFFRFWEPPDGARLVGLLRSAVAHDWMARLLREFMVENVLRHVAERVAPPGSDPAWRADLVASQMVGLAMARYVLRAEPLASASPDDVVAAVGPVVQHYLTGDLGR
jgi:AcrR family transcriptional regulator